MTIRKPELKVENKSSKKSSGKKCLAINYPVPTNVRQNRGGLALLTARNAYRAAMLRDLLWDKGQTLNIGFKDGSDEQISWVENVIMGTGQAKDLGITGLANYVNLKFNFISNPIIDTPEKSKQYDIDILVSFKGATDEAWSEIGRESKHASHKCEASMVLGWLDTPYESSKTRGSGAVVLHEFGHAIGCIHEHQNPCGNQIDWDVDAIKKEMEGVWDEETIKINITNMEQSPSLYGTHYDPTSIMHYFFPASWTKNNMEGNLNSKLSPTDIQLLGQVYTTGLPPIEKVLMCENGVVAKLSTDKKTEQSTWEELGFSHNHVTGKRNLRFMAFVFLLVVIFLVVIVAK